MATAKKAARKSASKKRASSKKKASKKASKRVSTRSAASTASRGKVHKVMKEYKAGSLHSRSKKGPRVKSRRQAVAIALSEAGLSRRTSSARRSRARRSSR